LRTSKILCNFAAQFRNCIKKTHTDGTTHLHPAPIRKRHFRSGSVLTAIEVKSSMTYKADFDKTLKMLPQWTSTPIVRRSVVYGGDFENVAGDIWVLRYNHINQLFRK